MRFYALLFILVTFFQTINAQIINPVGSGLTLRGTVYDFALDDQSDKRYAVGDFSGIDGIKMEKVGVKENGEWSAILDPSEITGVIFCAEVHKGDLYIGGNFTISANTEITNLAKLENGAWQPLGVKEMSGSIRALTLFEDELYVTGDFRNINGIENKGVMKYSNGQWEDSGLDSYLNAEGLFTSGASLYAWGNGFSTDGGRSHTVSIYKDGQWTTLPIIGTDPSVASGCLVYNGDIYCMRYSGLNRFDFNTNEWVLVTSLLFSPETSILFEYKGDLCFVFDNSEFYRLQDESLEKMEFQNPNDFGFESIYAVKSEDDKILVGGYFQHWESNSISLAIIDNMEIVSDGKVSSHYSRKTLKTGLDYSYGSSIVRYNDKYIIAGTFTFADDIYSPNIVYWDGDEFSPFDVPLIRGIRQLEVFENELYAVIRGEEWSDQSLIGHTLIKFNGSKWVPVETSLIVEKLKIINNKLFVSEKNESDSYNGGPFYIQDNTWNELKPFPTDGPFDWFRYKDIQSYNGGYMMAKFDWDGDQLIYLPSDTSEWIVMDTFDVSVDHFYTFNGKKFLVNDSPSIIYEIGDGEVNIIAEDIETKEAFFFNLNDDLFFSAWNGETYRYNDQGTFELYNNLRIRDIEPISDNQYLAVLQSRSYAAGIETIELNNIGILSFERLEVEVEKDRQNICPKTHMQFLPITDHANVTYEWNFEGGIPSTSNAVHPMVKYNHPGTYTANLKATNQARDTIYTSTEVIVEDCTIPESRANNHDNHWIMGYEYLQGRGLGGFDFTFPDSVISARYFSPERLHSGTVIMSDVNGNLQFYSNGRSILNMNNQPIQGSDCLNAEQNESNLNYFYSNQSLLGLPAVDEDSIYFLFDLDPTYAEGEYWLNASNLSMTTIDMSRNNGQGEIVDCNEVIINDLLLNSTMQAARHHNGEDWWIIVGKFQSDEYYKILLTKNGVESVETAQWGRDYQSQFNGQSTFSPDGRYFAQIIREDQEVSIWKFDNQTGEMSDHQIYTIVPLDEFEYPQGCSFSPDSRFLYVSSLTQLRQIDLCDYDEIEVELIDTWDGSYEFIYPLLFGKQMLTPNQKVVVTATGNSHRSFGIIESPNEKGTNCNFKQHSLKISELTKNVADVIPIFPHFRNYPSSEECKLVSTKTPNTSDSFHVYPNPIGSNVLLHFSQKATCMI